MKKYVLKYKWNAIFFLFMGTLNAVTGLAMVYTMQYIVEIVTNHEPEKIPNMFAIVALYFFGTAVVILFYGIAKNRFLAKTMQAIRQDLFGSLLKKNMVTFSQNNTGYYASLFQNDLKVVETSLGAGFLILIQIQEITFSLIYAFLQNVVIGIALIGVGIVGMAIPLAAQGILKKNQERLMQEAAEHNAFINDSLHGYEVIKNYQAEKLLSHRYQSNNDEYSRKWYKATLFQFCTGSVTNVFIFTLQMLLIVISGILVLSGKVSISFIMVVVGLSNSVIGSMCTAIEQIVNLQSGKGICDKIMAEIETTSEGEMGEIGDFNDALTLEKVSFSYGEKTVLKDINISFEKGKHYLLVGESGSGKSTFIKLLLQYYEDYQGKICLDGRDVRNFSRESVTKQFAVIPQNVFVFEDTLRNNITLYDSYSEERIMEAIKKAGLEQLVNRLENGLDYVIKEGGANLSGGERQRISIARAFLHNRKIWIMDEATSNLDKEMAEQIEQTILSIPDITVIMIAHYYNEKTVERCDEVYRIEKKHVRRELSE